MPKFLCWCAPLTLMFVVSVFLELSSFSIKLTFFMAFLGLFIELIRSLVASKDAPANKRVEVTKTYYNYGTNRRNR